MSAGSKRSNHELLALEDAQLLRECEVDLYRASGPGGQKRNKTSSAVRLRHTPTGLRVIAREDRSQHVNRRRAIRRMRLAIALNVRAKTDPTHFSPSELLGSCLTGAATSTTAGSRPWPRGRARPAWCFRRRRNTSTGVMFWAMTEHVDRRDILGDEGMSR